MFCGSCYFVSHPFPPLNDSYLSSWVGSDATKFPRHLGSLPGDREELLLTWLHGMANKSEDMLRSLSKRRLRKLDLKVLRVRKSSAPFQRIRLRPVAFLN